ncbi:MAG: AAA family ATPase [Treponema sp.]|nr:AAA family ATPase [Treponema sp.]
MDKKKIEEMDRKYKEFLEKFPIEKLETMTLEEYTNLKRDSENYFCYWVETVLKDLGDIHGSTSSKFGIYRYDKTPKQAGIAFDSTYAWWKRFGKDASSAYNLVQSKIVDVAKFAASHDYEKIDEISEISPMFKWKIAYLYSGRDLVNWFSTEMLVEFAKHYDMKDASKKSKVSQLQEFLMKVKKNKGLSEADFSDELEKLKQELKKNGKNMDELSDDVAWECDKMVKEYVDLLEKSHNIILHGAPGTGKTYLAQEIADAMDAEYEFVQFHPSYDYTDFVEGLRPVKNAENSQIAFERRDGVFKAFCAKALAEPTKKFVFIIDEVNRGDMSKILGELFFAIEPGYRGKDKCRNLRTQYANLQEGPNEFDKALDITDANSYGHFFIPENVYIIGTMNDIDRGVESMDFAFRRRFAFCEIKAENTQEAILCGKDGLSTDVRDDAIARMNSLNSAIAETDGLSSDFQIGAAYFLNLQKLDGDFNSLWDYHLESLLKEYLRGTEDADSKLEKLKAAYDSPKKE